MIGAGIDDPSYKLWDAFVVAGIGDAGFHPIVNPAGINDPGCNLETAGPARTYSAGCC